MVGRAPGVAHVGGPGDSRRGGPFTDVDPNSEFAADIEYIAGLGVTLGCTIDGTKYCPKDPVTRGQMAAFIRRALGIPQVNDKRFVDVPPGVYYFGDATAILIQ